MAHVAPLLIAIVLGGASYSAAQIQDNGFQGLDLLRILAEKPWMALNRWDRLPRIVQELGPNIGNRIPDDEEMSRNYDDDEVLRMSNKRSAVATALNSGRRRRQPAPALGVLNDVGSFFDSLRDNLETLASLSPQQRNSLFQDTPTVVHAQASGGGGGGSGMRRLHALRPLRPTGNIRSYNRRSDVEAYPGANRHDPGLLWTGLGR
ncbi:uncharacterized protein [Epargyreus clarus]|uniref:uncharacterized protein n=1 Tax=Epargyreus clarus TaxID=520877 RepID=UPI003C2C89FE